MNSLPLGKHTHLGEYTLWITVPTLDLPNDHPKAQQLNFYDVMLTRTPVAGEFTGWNFYVDLNKSLLNLNLSERNPLYAKAFPPKYKGEQALALTQPEEEFQQEFQTYQWRKDMIMPLWRLSRRHVSELFNLLHVMVLT